MRPADSFDVLLIGGGNAGVSAAARLIRRGVTGVGIVEPQSVHTYRPLLSYVGSGQASMRSAESTQRSVTPRGARWIRDSALIVDTERKTVRCESGASYGYRDLIVCPGLTPDHDALPGIDAALATPAVTSNYLDRAEKTWQLVASMRAGGHALFTVPRAPVSCTGTTIKPLFLAAARWKQAGRLAGMDITLVVDRPGLSDAPELDARLRRHLEVLGVHLRLDSAVSALDPERCSISVTGRDGSAADIGYDMLHLVPPFRGPTWIETSGLAREGSHGLVDVDPLTFRHRRQDTVWAVGDCASVETDPSGGALRRQVAILVDNLIAARSDGEMTTYDGYTVAPVATDLHHLIAGEFDRSGVIASSLPSFLDPLAARRTAWAFDRYGLPQAYWNLILKGRL